jgi:hypothetical protein
MPQSRWEGDSVVHALRSSDLLHVEASRARVSQFASRLAEPRRRVVHVAPSWLLRRVQVDDGRVDATGCIGPDYPCFAIFFLLGSRGIVVF